MATHQRAPLKSRRYSNSDNAGSFFRFFYTDTLQLSANTSRNNEIARFHSSHCIWFPLFQICIAENGLYKNQMTYLFFESISVHHSGTYDCSWSSGNKFKSKSVHISVPGKTRNVTILSHCTWSIVNMLPIEWCSFEGAWRSCYFLSCVGSAEGFLSARLDKSKILAAQTASSSCLEAQVSYRSVLQHCFWEAPDKTKTKCIRETQVPQHR